MRRSHSTTMAAAPGRDDAAEMTTRMRGFMENPLSIRARVAKALEVLATQPEVDAARIAAIGYCFGGTAVLELARSGARGRRDGRFS